VFTHSVSPAYGYIKSALVKCSNGGGLGPRYNREEDPWSSIFNRQVVYYLNLLTSSRKQMTGRINGYPFPPFQPSWAEPPSLPPGVCTPPPGTSTPGGQPLRKHTSASGTISEAMGWARGGWEDHLELFSCFLGGRTAELVTSAGWPARFSGALLCEDQAGQYHKDRWMAGRYGAWVYIRDLSVLSYHSATRCRGGYTSSHTEKKHSETRERTNCWEDLQAKIVRRTPFLISIWFMFFVLCSLLFHAQVLIF